MKILLFALFSFTTSALIAQSTLQSTISKFKKEISLPFSTPSELPYVGEIADEVVEYLESDEEKKKYKDWELAYPEITDELKALVGDDSYALNGGAQYFPYGKFKIGETTFLMVLETGFEARNMQPFQSLVLLAFDKNSLLKDVRYIMHENIGYEYDNEEYEDAISVQYHTTYSSNLEVSKGILVIKTTEDVLTEIELSEETITEELSYETIFKYSTSEGRFDIQF